MSFVDNQPSRMQGQDFFEVRLGGQRFSAKSKQNLKFLARLPEGLRAHRPGPLSLLKPLPLKVCRGRFNIHPYTCV
jgi:hypothetical protein